MSSEWSSIVSTLAKMTLLTVLLSLRTNNLKGRGATLTLDAMLADLQRAMVAEANRNDTGLSAIFRSH